MATYIQQYNPWRENLAVNVLSGIINHIQENERNKKANAFLGQLTQNLSSNRQGNLLTPQNEPEGYNSNPWGQAFHQNNNPLTQFDFGTNGLVPQRQFSTSEILNEAARLQATPRFSNLNTQVVRDLITPYIQANEQARLENLRNQFADNFLNAGSNSDRINQAVSGFIRGVYPESAMNSIYNVYKPQNYLQNYGGEVRRGSVDLNGRFHDQDVIPVTPTQAELATLSENARQYANTQNENYINGQLADIDAQIKLRTDRITKLQEAAQNADPKAIPAINAEINRLNQEVQQLYDGKMYLRQSLYYPQQQNQSTSQPQPQQQTTQGSQSENTTVPATPAVPAAPQNLTTPTLSAPNIAQNTTQSPIPANALLTHKNGSYITAADVLRRMNDEGLTSGQVWDELEQAGYFPVDDNAVYRWPNPESLWQNNVTTPQNTQSQPRTQATQTAIPQNTITSASQLWSQLWNRVPSWEQIMNALSGQQPATQPSQGAIDWMDWFRHYVNPANSAALTNRFYSGNPAAPAQLTVNTPQPLLNAVSSQNVSDWIERYIQPANSAPNLPFSRRQFEMLNFSRPHAPVQQTAAAPQGYSKIPFYRPYNPYSPYSNWKRQSAPLFSQKINSLIQQNAENFSRKYGVFVDPDLVSAVIRAESSGRSNAVSNKGAQGLMQLMPGTAKMLGVTDSFDVAQNIRGGVEYLAQQLRKFGSIEKALWAYNAGPGKVQKNIMPNETRDYIQKVLNFYRHLKGE